jgi:hypothetical protein
MLPSVTVVDAAGSVSIVMTGVDGTDMVPYDIVIFSDAPALSVTVIVAVPDAAAVVGVPEMTPSALIDNPAGRSGELNEYGSVPPDAPPDTLMFVIAVPVADAGMSNEVLCVNASGVGGPVTTP